VLANVERILAIELLVGAQALDLRLALTEGVARSVAGAAAGSVPGRGVADAHRRIRSVIAPQLVDREMGADIAAALALVRSGELAGLVEAPRAASPGAG
jgi:histidine ammonia-lyase